jgi:tetratricopeptide (TPR) repeat protein
VTEPLLGVIVDGRFRVDRLVASGGYVTVLSMQLDAEIGRPSLADAERFWELQESLLDEVEGHLFLGRPEHRLMIAAALHRAGKLSSAELEKARADMDRSYREAASDFRWEMRAASAETRAEALEILESAPATTQVPARLFRNPARGKLLFLAERWSQALHFLEQEAGWCLPLHAPVEHVRRSLVLGQTYERLGEKTKACGAYRRVLDRWGKAVPRSVSADDARARMARLGC